MPRESHRFVQPLEPRKLFAANSYIEQDLTSDGSVAAAHVDARLVNPWGIVAWGKGMQVADADSGFTTGYDASGNAVVGAVAVPGPGGSQGAPTGVVYNNSLTQFRVTVHSAQSPAQFIYATEDGTIDGWSTLNKNRNVVVAVNNSASGAVYKGLALANVQNSPHLYAANFTLGRIDVFDSNFQVSHLTGNFVDPRLPAHFNPFNVQLIGGKLFVTYAKRNKGSTDPVKGLGAGLVDIFNTDGTFVKRFASGGKLNAPWGITQAPANFAAFSNDILVGNFGDGRITAFNPTTGALVGQLNDSNTQQPLSIDGLWGLAFGNGRGNTLTNGLYFTAGPADEAHGLYGRLLVDPYATSPIAPQSLVTAATKKVTHSNDVATLVDGAV